MATDQLPVLPIEPSGLLHRDDGYYTWTKGREPERGSGGVFCVPFFTEADVRAAIAADHARAVPVAWLITGGRVFADQVVREERAAKNGASQRNDGSTVVPLYTRPPAPEQPADLSGQAATAAGEPDMRHPKIQALIGAKARREIELQMIEDLIDSALAGESRELSAHNMEYWTTVHDKFLQFVRSSLSTPASGEGR